MTVLGCDLLIVIYRVLKAVLKLFQRVAYCVLAMKCEIIKKNNVKQLCNRNESNRNNYHTITYELSYESLWNYENDGENRMNIG